MRRRILGSIAITFAMLSLGMIGQSADPLLKVSIAAIPGATCSHGAIPLKLTFENVSAKKIRILDAFHEPKALPVFFQFEMKASDGTPIPIAGAGKIDFSKDSLHYVQLAKGQKYEVMLNLADIIPPDEKLKEGVYGVSLTYYNQYGENCFQGKVTSNLIQLHIRN